MNYAINFYFFILRFYVLFFFIALICDCELFFISYNLFFFHLLSGITSIFNDYIHLKKLKLLLTFITKVLIITTTSIILEINF